jgi:hypothetical protein
MSIALRWLVACTVLLLFAGCGGAGARSDGGASAADGGRDDGGKRDAGLVSSDGGEAVDGGLSDAGADGGGSGDGGSAEDGGAACPRTPAAPDRARVVVVSHPYDAQGRQANTYEVLTLSTAGALSRRAPALSFEMGRATEGDIVFTPDGEIGLSPQGDGSIGVFRVRPDGAIEVIHERFREGFFAERIVVSAGGESAYVLDANFPENGGGVYRVRIGCDGRLSALGRWASGKGVRGLVELGDGGRIVAGKALLDSPAGDDVHRLAAGDAAVRTGGADAFGDDEAIVSALALTADGRYALVGDNNAFSGLPNRVAVAAPTQDGQLSRVQVLTPVDDPVALVASPFDDAVLVASGFGNALLLLRYDPRSRTPFTSAGALVYSGARPQLPANAVMVARGALRGRVLVSENLGVRQVQFGGDGGVVTDLGLTSLGSGSANIVGIVGVQP